MLLAVGRLIPADRVSTSARSQIDIATTVGSLLGFAAVYSQGANLLDDPVTASDGQLGATVGKAELEASPNPFNGMARITYAIPRDAHVRLEVYDLLGRRLCILADAYAATGRHSVTFEAGELPSGIYALRLEAGEFSAGSRVLLLK